MPTGKIVFDSPAKTKEEIEYAIKLGVHLNADSFEELDRINRILNDLKPKGTFGIRVNPQVGTGKISSTSVAGYYSKFGIPLNEKRHEIVDGFASYDWLTGVHLHVGSQGCSIEMLLNGIGGVLDLVNEINENLRARGISKRVMIFDLGGGLPVS